MSAEFMAATLKGTNTTWLRSSLLLETSSQGGCCCAPHFSATRVWRPWLWLVPQWFCRGRRTHIPSTSARWRLAPPFPSMIAIARPEGGRLPRGLFTGKSRWLPQDFFRCHGSLRATSSAPQLTLRFLASAVSSARLPLLQPPPNGVGPENFFASFRESCNGCRGAPPYVPSRVARSAVVDLGGRVWLSHLPRRNITDFSKLSLIHI